jgi:hypothetical protein
MFNIIKENEKRNNKLKLSMSTKYNKEKLNKISIGIEEDHFSPKRNILKNVGKEICKSQKCLTINKKYNSPTIINEAHKGIQKKGYALYDPILIQICKSAIIREKKELPHYKEIIKKVNTEFGIEDEKFDDDEQINSSNNSKSINNNNLKNNLSSLFNNSDKTINSEEANKK